MTFFARLCSSVVLVLTMSFSSFATTHQYVQSVEPEIVKSISETLKKGTFEKEILKVSLLQIKFPPPATNEKNTPVEIESSKLVIDDVIVMLNDTPLEVELLSFNSTLALTNSHSFLPNQSPG